MPLIDEISWAVFCLMEICHRMCIIIRKMSPAEKGLAGLWSGAL